MVIEARPAVPRRRNDPSNELHLTDLIRLAVMNRLIDELAERQAGLAKDARNLIIGQGVALRRRVQQNDGAYLAHGSLPHYRRIKEDGLISDNCALKSS